MKPLSKLLTLALFAILLHSPIACADEQVVTYLEYNGKVIELFEIVVDQLFKVPAGSMAAYQMPELLTVESRNRIDEEDQILRTWRRDGDDWIVIDFSELKTSKRFHKSEIKTIFSDRPWTNKPSTTERPSSV